VENHELVASNLSGIVAACRTSPKGRTNSSATACCITASPPRALILMTGGRCRADCKWNSVLHVVVPSMAEESVTDVAGPLRSFRAGHA
jgi:hypothetical protein